MKKNNFVPPESWKLSSWKPKLQMGEEVDFSDLYCVRCGKQYSQYGVLGQDKIVMGLHPFCAQERHVCYKCLESISKCFLKETKKKKKQK